MRPIKLLRKTSLVVGVLAGLAWLSHSVTRTRRPAEGPVRTRLAPAHAIKLNQIAPVIVENRGQLNSDALYYIQRRTRTVQFGVTGITFAMAGASHETARVRPIAASLGSEA